VRKGRREGEREDFAYVLDVLFSVILSHRFYQLISRDSRYSSHYIFGVN
jgi:hypothetical protein